MASPAETRNEAAARKSEEPPVAQGPAADALKPKLISGDGRPKPEPKFDGPVHQPPVSSAAVRDAPKEKAAEGRQGGAVDKGGAGGGGKQKPVPLFDGPVHPPPVSSAAVSNGPKEAAEGPRGTTVDNGAASTKADAAPGRSDELRRPTVVET